MWGITISRKYYIAIILFTLFELLFADPNYQDIKKDLFKISDSDLSRNILANIFGNINVGGVNLLDIKRYSSNFQLAPIIKIFNYGILLFASSYISYSLIISALNYSQHGGPMEAEKHSSWLPARMIMGSIMLIPNASGYTIVQAIVMSVVLSGVGLADFIWGKVVQQVSQHGVVPGGANAVNNYHKILIELYRQGSYSGDAATTGSVIGLNDIRAISTCVSAYKYLAKINDEDKIFGIWTGAECDEGNGFCVGSLDNKTLCGSYKFRSDNAAINQAFVSAISNDITYVDGMFNLPGSVCTGFSCKAEDSAGVSFIALQANSFSSILKQLVKMPQPKDLPSSNSWADNSMKLGWISAAEQYRHFVVRKDARPAEYDISKVSSFLPVVGRTGYNLNNEDLLPLKNLGNIIVANNRQFNSALKMAESQNNQVENNNDIPINYDDPLIKILNYVAVKADSVFLGVKDEMFDASNTIFSIETNLRVLADISLTIARDNALVMIARIFGDTLGINLVDGGWYKPGIMPDKQPVLFRHLCKGGLKQPGCLKADNSGIIGAVINYEAGKRVDPMQTISDFGLSMLYTSLGYFVNTSEGLYKISLKLLTPYTIASGTLTAVIGLVSGIPYLGSAVKAMQNQAGKVFQILLNVDIKSMTAYLPFTGTIAGLFFIAGVLISVYIPFIPYAVFLFCVIGWVISVIESMLAAPLIALGVTHPQGHDLLGKSEQSVILLLGIFVRPAAILIGFVISIFLMYIAWTLLNIGYMVSFASYLSVIPTYNSFMLSAFVYMSLILLYVYILIGITNQVFGLTYHVPEKLMRWIGLSPEVVGVSQMLGQFQQGMQAGVSQVTEGGKRSLTNAPRLDPDLNLSGMTKPISKKAYAKTKKLFKSAYKKMTSKKHGSG